MQQQAVTKGSVVFESSDSPRTATISPSIRPEPTSLQLRPSQSNFRCHNITEKSEYDIKNPTTGPAGPQLTNTGHADRAKQSLNHENKEKAKKLLQELIIFQIRICCSE